jgi:hypothetical protein
MGWIVEESITLEWFDTASGLWFPLGKDSEARSMVAAHERIAAAVATDTAAGASIRYRAVVERIETFEAPREDTGAVRIVEDSSACDCGAVGCGWQYAESREDALAAYREDGADSNVVWAPTANREAR